MSDEFTLDPSNELPLEALLTKPVYNMTDEELALYRAELQLLRRPQTLTAKLNGEASKAVRKTAVAKASVLANKYC